MTLSSGKIFAGLPPWNRLSTAASSLFTDIPIALAGFALFFGLLSLAHYWSAPVHPQAHIDLSPGALPLYSLFSIARLGVRLPDQPGLRPFVWLSRRQQPDHVAERLMIRAAPTRSSRFRSLWFPPRGNDLDGRSVSRRAVWIGARFHPAHLHGSSLETLAFSVFSSLKNIPREMQGSGRETSYGLSWWQRSPRNPRLPNASIGLIWNSMMSVAAGWFSLMVCEMFVLGDRDLRLPGLGSYLQSASNAGSMRSIRLGIVRA